MQKKKERKEIEDAAMKRNPDLIREIEQTNEPDPKGTNKIVGRKGIEREREREIANLQELSELLCPKQQ